MLASEFLLPDGMAVGAIVTDITRQELETMKAPDYLPENVQ